MQIDPSPLCHSLRDRHLRTKPFVHAQVPTARPIGPQHHVGITALQIGGSAVDKLLLPVVHACCVVHAHGRTPHKMHDGWCLLHLLIKDVVRDTAKQPLTWYLRVFSFCTQPLLDCSGHKRVVWRRENDLLVFADDPRAIGLGTQDSCLVLAPGICGAAIYLVRLELKRAEHLHIVH